MSYEKVMADHDLIARICRELQAGLDRDGIVLEETLGTFSQLSIAIDTLAAFELATLCPRLLAIEGDFATRAGIRFRESVQALSETKAHFMTEWCADCIRADPDEFRVEAHHFIEGVLRHIEDQSRTVYPFALKVGALPLR